MIGKLYAIDFHKQTTRWYSLEIRNRFM